MRNFKQQYKIVVADGAMLHDVMTKIETEVNRLMEQGWEDNGALTVKQCGSRYVVYKEMTLSEYDDSSGWITTVSSNIVDVSP